MFSIDIIAKAKAKVNELNTNLVELNKLNSPKLVKLSTCVQQIHAIESVVNGTLVEKVASLGMVYYPYNEAPVQHLLCSSIVSAAKLNRLGLKDYIIFNGVINISAYLVTK